MEQLHLFVLVVHFGWNALVSYSKTPEGQSDLADIELIVNAMENPTPNAQTAGTSPSAASQQSTSQIIRK